MINVGKQIIIDNGKNVEIVSPTSEFDFILASAVFNDGRSLEATL